MELVVLLLIVAALVVVVLKKHARVEPDDTDYSDDHVPPHGKDGSPRAQP